MTTYAFGDFRLDTAERQLWRGDREIALTAKAFDVLLLLVTNQGRTVTKEEFMASVWADTVVEEANLTDNVSTLRQLLGDDARDPKYIRTTPRRGYRFIADVRRENDYEDVVVREQSRAHLVIEEEVEAPPQRKALAGGRARWLAAVAIGGAIIAALAAWLVRRASTPAQPRAQTAVRTIAVLPFKPLDEGRRDPALELGMTDALISRLSRIRDITVRPTSSVSKYTARNTDYAAVGSELGVDAVLDGMVQKAGDRVSLSVQLVRPSDGAVLWAGKFNEQFTGIFEVQDAISTRAADVLELRLTRAEKQGLSKRYTNDVAAYQLYLQGQVLWRSFSPPKLMSSINYYEEALRRDPTYALAYVGLANSYSVIGIYGPLPIEQAMTKSREAAMRAIALDPDLADAHAALGAVKLTYDWDWEGAKRELDRAMALDPKQVDAPELYAYYLHAVGRGEEAVRYLERAKELDPLFPVALSDYAFGLYFARRYPEAIAECQRLLRLDPERAPNYRILAKSYAALGRWPEALEMSKLALSKATDRSRGYHASLADVGYIEGKLGNRAAAEDVIAQIEKSGGSWVPLLVAQVYAGLGDADQTFAWLRKGLQIRTPFLYRFRLEPAFDWLRSDPRYAETLRAMNLS